MVVAVQTRTHGEEVAHRHRCFARVGVGIARVAHQRQNSFVRSGKGASINGDASKCADNRLGCGPQLMGTLRAVAVEVLFHHQLSILVEKHAVNIFVGAVEDGAHNRFCRRDSEV